MKSLALGVVALAAIASSLATPAFADVAFGTPRLLGEFVLPTGVAFDGIEVGGISGMDYDARNDIYYAISDDRSEHGPARFYTLKLKIDAKGVHGVDFLSTVPLRGPDGNTYLPRTIDPESIRYDSATGHLFWSSEGDANGNPGIYEAQTDGTMLRSLKLPDYYLPNADHTQGALDNLNFESLAFSSDHKFLFAGLENGLAQDGGKTTLDSGSLSRIIKFDVASGTPVAEYPIEIEKIHNRAKDGKTNDNGMSEFMLLDDDTLLTMERGFSLGVGNEINLYLTKLAGATDVSGKAVIKGTEFTPVSKQLVLKIGEGDFGLDIDNVECLTWGPVINGTPTIVLASDNNFSGSEFTQFVVFALDGYKAE